MRTLVLILGTALLGVVATWLLTGGIEGGGNPVASVLVGFAVALLWARGFSQLEKRYLQGEFDRVLRWLPLWKDSLGELETFLLKAWIMIESRREDELEGLIQQGRARGMGEFLEHWARGHQGRLDQSAEEGLKAFREGIESDTFGMDRVELQCEAAKLLLEVGPHTEAEAVGEEWLAGAINLSNKAGSLLREIETNSDGKSRYGYLSLFHRGLRGLIYMRQRRWAQANRIFEEVIGQASNRSSLRSRRLARYLEINQLRVLYASHGMGRFSKERERLAETGLPELKLRLSEVEQEVREAEEAAEEEVGESDPFLSDPEAFARYQEKRIQRQEAREQTQKSQGGRLPHEAEVEDIGLEESPEEELDERLRTRGIDDEDNMIIAMEEDVFEEGEASSGAANPGGSGNQESSSAEKRGTETSEASRQERQREQDEQPELELEGPDSAEEASERPDFIDPDADTSPKADSET